MPIDFRASQIETNKLIASGSTGTETGAQLLIYSHLADDSAAPNQGFIDQTKFVTSSIGTDIFLYVSGGINQKNVVNAKAITAFGGDVHISGNLSIQGSATIASIDTYLTGTALTTMANSSTDLSGNILSFILANNSTVYQEFSIVGAGADVGGSNPNYFAASYKVTSKVNNILPLQKTVFGVVEMSRNTDGTDAAGWEVNVNNEGVVSVTGSTSIDVYWYGRTTSLFGINYVGTIVED